MRPIDMEPTSEAEVFDMLHGLFGIGDFNSDDPKPWHHFRMIEIARIKGIRKKRRWTFADFAMVARYCHRHRIHVKGTYDLLPNWAAAKVDQANQRRGEGDRRINAAVEAERAAGLPDSEEWIARLVRSAGAGRQAVLEEWAQKRQRALLP